MAKRAVFYLRLSVAQDEIQSDSIGRQERDLRTLAEREGWQVVKVLVDDGVSGRKARRNADEAIRMIRDGEADVLAVWKLDRLTREGISALGKLLAALDERPEAEFLALQDGLRSHQASWRIIASVLAEVARMEADNTSMRVSASIRDNRRQGRFVGGTVPFGYRAADRLGGGRTLLPYAPEAEIVREVADRILSDESQASILQDLTARGIPTTRSAYRIAEMRGAATDGLDRGSWSYSALSAIWAGDAVLGRVSQSRIVANAEGKKVRKWEIVRDSNGQPLVAFEPVIDNKTAGMLRAKLRNPKLREAPRPRRPRRARLLSGVIFCDECGNRLWVTHHGGRAVYSCRRAPGRCSGPNMKAELAERAVSEAFLSAVGGTHELRRIQSVAEPSDAAELASIELELREALAELREDGADGPLLLARIESLKARRLELHATPQELQESLVPTGRTLSEAWLSSNDDEKRNLLLSALDHVTLTRTPTKGHTGYHPERIRMHWLS